MKIKITGYALAASLAGALAFTGCTTTSKGPATNVDLTTAQPAAAVGATGSYLVNLTKKAPSLVSVGDTFMYELVAAAQTDVAEATVVDTLAEGATYVSSEPAAVKEGNKLTWHLGNITRGESKAISVTVKAVKEGELANCATVSAIPRVCVSTMVGRPQLTVKKTGPEMAQLGQEIPYTVVVQNTGNVIAKDVVVTDSVPEGLSSAGGEKELTFNVGELGPSVSKTITVPLKAEKRGKVTNKVVAASSNAGKADAEASTTIVQAGVKIEKTTKDKELFVNRAAAYDIVVQNTGDTDLSDVVVTDTAAAETVIATAEGAMVAGNTATWNVGELKVGDKKSFAVKVLSKVPGTFTDTATVTTAQGLKGSAQDSTVWKGVTGILVEMIDDPDPIQVGETTTFTVRVTNQGTTTDIRDLSIVATLADELELVPGTVSGQGVASGKTITWPTVARVAPRSSVVCTYIVKGLKAGDARSKASVTTSMRKEPIEKFESTTVY